MNSGKIWNRILFITGVSLCFISGRSFAQQVQGDDLEKTTLVAMPQLYTAPTGKELGLKGERIKTGDRKWVVYSDKEDNKTYFDKNCTQEKMKLGFLEAFVVAQETEDALRLVRFDPSNAPFEDKPGSKTNELVFRKGASAEDVGWIRKRNVLMWSNAMVNDTNKYTIKAVAVKKLESNDITALIKRGILDLYTVPEEIKEYDANKDITLFQYLFVYKKVGDLYLLGKGNRTNASTISDDILGWAPAKQLHVWGNAICLRVNFDPEAVQERVDKKIEVSFFRTLPEAKTFKDKATGAALPFYYDPTKESANENPYLLGFPIIDETATEKGIYKTGYVTNTVSTTGKTIFSVRKIAGLTEKFETIKREKQNVNIIFVIDGTMKNSFKVISSAVNSISYIGGSDDITRMKYKIGAVIYNDANDEFSTQPIALTPSKDSFIDRLNMESTKPSSAPVNRDANGAPLYAGIKKACDMFPKSENTNIIVVVGGTTDPNKPGRTTALQALVDKEVKMSFMQVVNKDGELYDGFIRDCRFFLTNSAESLDKKYFSDEIAAGEVKKAKVVAAENYAYIENSVATGTFYWKDIGQSFQASEMKRYIQQLVNQNEQKMSGILSKWDVVTSGAERGEDLTDDESIKNFIALLKEANIKDEDIEILARNQNFQLFISAYAPVVTDKLENPLLVRTLFMSSREFQRLLDTFDKLGGGYASGVVRDNVVNTYKNIIVSYKGGNENLDEIGSKYDLKDFLTLVTGLQYISNNPLFDRKIDDLDDPKKTSQEDIEKLKVAFLAISKKLGSIKKNSYYKVPQEEDDFYWIPESTFQVNL